MTEAGGPLQEADRKGAAMVACAAIKSDTQTTTTTIWIANLLGILMLC